MGRVIEGVETVLTAGELEKQASEMRAWALAGLHAAGSGHSGGSLSCMDIMACLYFNVLRHDPSNPKWGERDRFIISKAHAVPALYAALGQAGYFPREEIVYLRRIGSAFQGHSDMVKGGPKGVEMSGGSLGQGLGVAVGVALAARLDQKDYRVYCLMGDGEQQEGSVWEAAMAAAHYKLDNLKAIVDCNGLQIDGRVEERMNIAPLAEKYRAFGWEVFEADGHDMEGLLKAFEAMKAVEGKPSLLIARTVKGKGVSFMEDEVDWHGRAPDEKEFTQALQELNVSLPVEDLMKKAKAYQEKVDAEIAARTPKYSQDYWWNKNEVMKSEMKPSRAGFGAALAEKGDDERLATVHADLAGSIKISDFEKGHPEREKRSFSVGIAEQNMTLVAAGLAKEGKIPVEGSFGVFASGRPWDMLRTSVCYPDLNVKVASSHAGLFVGEDGPTHQSLEEITLTNVLPNMRVFVPSDYLETKRITEKALFEVQGPCYLRYGREKTAVISTAETPCELGIANVIRFKGEKENFAEAFETTLSTDYKDEGEDLAIVACGQMVPEAMRAAWILKKEFGLEARVVNLHTIKPLDEEALVKAARETKAVLTVEEHQVGGMGNLVAGVIGRKKNLNDQVVMDMMGVADRFGESGKSWTVLKYFGLTAEFIADRAKKLVDRKK